MTLEGDFSMMPIGRNHEFNAISGTAAMLESDPFPLPSFDSSDISGCLAHGAFPAVLDVLEDAGHDVTNFFRIRARLFRGRPVFR